MNQLINRLAIFFAIILVISSIIIIWTVENNLPTKKYSEFLHNLSKNTINNVEFNNYKAIITGDNGKRYQTIIPDKNSLISRLEKKNVSIEIKEQRFYKLLPWILGFVLLIICPLFLLSRQKKSTKETNFGDGKQLPFKSVNQKITFNDIAGIPEAKEELFEIIDFIKDPSPFNKIGASIPKGVLLQGPPGTGKTLLAKAIAGEANVPFFSISGSDFVEVFVGVGASRIRELFQSAKKQSPCIIFIDEIDAVGTTRSDNSGGGQDERSQTLNALLVEMDGFGSEENIIVLAATNRPDILDPALSRAGRFDRQITIMPPDVKGRKEILKIYSNKVSIDPSIELEDIARNTPGFTGAELANLVNEAALLAARQKRNFVKTSDFETARDRVLMGIERKSLIMNKTDRKTMAYHEAGHAIVARTLHESDPIHKITIIPRGMALGQMQQIPLIDRHAYSREFLNNKITILMGGKAAEYIAFNQQTTGAQDDISQATEIATKMVCSWAMTDTIPPRTLAKIQDNHLGENLSTLSYSDEMAVKIDDEISKLLKDCYQQAVDILTDHKHFLGYLAEIILQNETIDNEELEIIHRCSIKKQAELESNTSETHDCSNCPASDHCTHKKIT